MSSESVLSSEIKKMHEKENEMYTIYSGLLGGIKDKKIKSKIKHLRDDEYKHIELVTQLMSVLLKYIE